MAVKEKVSVICSKVFSFFNKGLAFFNKHSKPIFSIVAVLTLIITSLYTGVILAYNVEYNGKAIAIVKSKADFEDAVNFAQDMVECERIRDYAYTPAYSMTITVEDKITDTAEIAQTIIEETETINKADALFINGEYFACTSSDNALQKEINNYLESYNSSFDEACSSFVEDVKVESGYYPTENLCELSVLFEKLKELEVKTTVKVRNQTAIPFGSVTRKTDTRYVGDTVRAVAGQEGIEETVENIVYINGEEISREVLESTVVKSPIDEVIVIGTKKRTTSSGSTSSLNLIWPLKRVENQIISSYWGDGRNHQAIDIASPLGTPIYAAQGGVVVTSTYISSYGNYIIIDHGNGYQTCYAHASRLYVSVGENVAQGQVIAAVGSTGNSTGNHLHFEVRKNGTKLDPAGFLGLY